MNLLKNFSLFIITFLFLLSCTKPIERLSQKESSLKSQGDYNAYLALEYLSFSRKLLTVKDKSTSRYFAKKGLFVARGEEPTPENPLKWKADKGQLEEMVLMQKRLEMVLVEPHLKYHLPIQLAHLTYLYDCWITRESKAIFRSDELAQCRVRFTKLLDEVENYIDDSKRDKTPIVEIKEPKFERFEILFDFNIAKFNDRAVKDLLGILKYLASLNGNYRILLVGNADRVGRELYNQNLALMRAETVKNYLVKNGVTLDQIEMRSVGEDFPDIVSLNGSQMQSNRTVGIYILKGYRSFATFPLPLIENYVYREEIKKARAARGLKE